MIAAGVDVLPEFEMRNEDPKEGDARELALDVYRAVRRAPGASIVPEVRGSARERGYNARWEKARKTYLMRRPLCVMCAKEGRTTVATVVDHIKPHKGDTKLFWDTSNWQSLCKPHHDRDKQRAERGSTQAVDADGWPI